MGGVACLIARYTLASPVCVCICFFDGWRDKYAIDSGSRGYDLREIKSWMKC